ncbi:MAG: RdgB/HAM1 family non-canonical purine NTP pyrophosphatase [Bacteroidetes bacterium]|nr:RdgB/HAM1 family non-canonical purine NTP pyrophosphatase [Bacteroidota bacterium]
MQFILATHNLNKIKEIKKAFDDADIEIMSLHDFPDLPDVMEDGETIEENSLKKAKEIFEHTGIAAIADDTGLEVDYLDGAPGVYAARFAGENCTYEDNNLKMLNSLKGVSRGKRGAKFRCIVTLYGENLHHVTEGILDGEIIEKLTGKNGFGYDPIFKPNGFELTLAELSLDDKNKISHRGQAVSKMVEIIRELKRKKI